MCSTTSSEPVVAAITQEAIDAIRRAQLTPIEHKILVAFVEAAESPELAGNEVLRRLRAGQDEGCSPEETLRALKDDWHEIVATGTPLLLLPISGLTLAVTRLRVLNSL